MSEGTRDLPVVQVPLTHDSVAEVECPYCGSQRRVEPDAKYTVTCETCDRDYRITSFL